MDVPEEDRDPDLSTTDGVLHQLDGVLPNDFYDSSKPD